MLRVYVLSSVGGGPNFSDAWCPYFAVKYVPRGVLIYRKISSGGNKFWGVHFYHDRPVGASSRFEFHSSEFLQCKSHISPVQISHFSIANLTFLLCISSANLTFLLCISSANLIFLQCKFLQCKFPQCEIPPSISRAFV